MACLGGYLIPIQEADGIPTTFWSRDDKIVKCQWSSMRYTNHHLYKFLFSPAIPHLPLYQNLQFPTISRHQNTNPVREMLLLCSYLIPPTLQWHNSLTSVTLFLLGLLLFWGIQKKCHKPHTRQGHTQFLLYMKQANPDLLQEEVHSQNTPPGRTQLWTATSRGVSSHAFKWHIYAHAQGRGIQHHQQKSNVWKRILMMNGMT